MRIEINRLGIIEEGDDQGWEVYIEDDQLNTGGYLILVGPGLKSKKPEGYDNWVENFDALQKYFKEAHWKIKWLDS